MRNTSISIIANNKVVQQFDIHGQSMSVKAIANVDFVIQEQHSGKSPKQLKAKRQHNDLVLYADGDDVSLIIQDYYTTEDVGILGVQDNGMASYGLNSSQVSQLSGEETIYGLSNTVIDNSTSNDYTSYLLGLLGVGAVIGIATSNDNKSTAQPSTQQTTPTTPTQPSTPTEAKITEVIANKSVNEGENLVATVKLDNTNGNGKVAFALSGLEANDYGNATFSNGLSKNADGTLNIPKGIQSFTVALPIVADKATEGNQTLTIKVGDKTATTTIVDTSTTPVAPPAPTPDAVVSEMVANKSVNEGENLVATVKLDNTNGNGKVAFALSGLEMADYTNATFNNGVTKNADGTLTVPKGIQEFTITLPIVADKLTEGNQTLTVKVGDKTATTTIVDTSTAPVTPPAPTPTPTDAVVSEVVANKSVNEGETVTATVKLDNANGNGKVAFALSGLEANDYGNATFSGGVTKNVDGTLTVPKGIQEFTITLPIVADKLTEGNQTLSLDIGGKKASVEVVDTSIAEIKGIDVDTRIIDANWDLQGGPTEKERISDNTYYYKIPNSANVYTKHHTDGSGTATTNKDDTIRVSTVGRVDLIDSDYSIKPNASIDMAQGNDKLELFRWHAGNSMVHFGEGDDTYLNHSSIEGNAKIFMEAGNDTLTVENSTNSASIYLGQGNDILTMNKVSFSSIDLGSGKFFNANDYKPFYNDGITSLNNDTADTKENTNTANINFLDSSTIQGSLANDNLTIDTTAGTNTVNLDEGNNTITINKTDGISGSLTTSQSSSITAGTGNDSVTINGTTTHFNINVGDGDNVITLAPTAGSSASYQGDIIAGSGADKITFTNVSTVNRGAGSIHAGAGNNIINISGRIFGNITALEGKDTVTLDDYYSGTLSLGEGNDELTIRTISEGVNSKSEKDIPVINLGGGNNTFTLLDTTQSGHKYKLTALDGDDTHDAKNVYRSTIDLGDGTNKATFEKLDSTSIKTGLGNDSIEAKSLDGTIKIDAGAGDNTINIGNDTANFAMSKDSTITTLDGNDSVVIKNTNEFSGTQATTNLGAGNDTLLVQGNYKGSIDVGSGKNSVNITGNNTGNISALEGDDVVNVAKTQTSGIISLGDGNNTVTLGGVMGANTINTGTGNDTIHIAKDDPKQNVAGGANINTGAGVDHVFIGGDSRGIIDLGADNNTLEITGRVIANISMGDGNDTVSLATKFNERYINAVEGINISLGHGQNNLSMTGPIRGAEITVGDDDDTINITGSYSNSHATKNTITLGNGNNTFNITGDAELNLIGGTGKDIVNIGGKFSSNNNQKINLGDGENELTIGSGTNTETVAGIFTGKDKDIITINGNNRVGINAGDGDNIIHIKGNLDEQYDGGADITTLNGNDTITIDGYSKAGINTGAGDDTVYLGNLSQYSNTNDVNGGDGFDVLNITSNVGGTDLYLSNFINFEVLDLTSVDGLANNKVVISSSFGSNFPAHQSGLFIRGDDVDTISLNTSNWHKDGKTTDKFGQEYDVWVNNTDATQILNIQNNLIVI